jgi:hypothetical protein
MILPTSDLYRKLYSVACLRARPYQPLAVEWERTGQRRRKEMVIDSCTFQGVVTSHWEIAGTAILTVPATLTIKRLEAILEKVDRFGMTGRSPRNE